MIVRDIEIRTDLLQAFGNERSTARWVQRERGCFVLCWSRYPPATHSA